MVLAATPKLPYSPEALLARGTPRVYTGRELTHLAWPLGELGASWVALGGHGDLRALASPAPPLPRLVLAVARPTGAPTLRLLQTTASPGLPEPCAGVTFEAAFPFARLRLENPLWPLAAVLEAHTPFVPGDLAISSLPACQLTLHLRHPGRQTQRAALLVCLPPGTAGQVKAWRDGALAGLSWTAPHAKAKAAPGWELASAWPAALLPGEAPAAGSGHGPLVSALREIGDATGGDYLILLADMPAKQALSLPLWLSWPACGKFPVTPDNASPRATLHYLAIHHDKLTHDTRAFGEALHASTLPAAVLEAVSGQLLTLAHAQGGIGSMAFPWFFPERARDFASTIIPEATNLETLSTALLSLYRDLLFSGEDAWMRAPWQRLSAALHQAITTLDADGDGWPEKLPTDGNTITRYLSAMRAAEELARQLGEDEAAAAWHRYFELGQAMFDAAHFNGDYYQTELCEVPDEPSGASRVDQLDGQLESRLLHLGSLLDPDHLEQAMASIFERHWQVKLPAQRGRKSTQPKGEAGLASSVVGGKRAAPVGCGQEYRLASQMFYESHLAEGLSLVRGARDRYTGVYRNPWLEREHAEAPIEGQHAWSMLLAISDLSYSAPAHALHFAPRLYSDDFACLLVVPGAWGLLRQKDLGEARREVRLELLCGELRVATLSFGFPVEQVVAKVGDQVLLIEVERFGINSMVRLLRPLKLSAGQTLVLDCQTPEELIEDEDAEDAILPTT